jgi:hypothetical protein
VDRKRPTQAPLCRKCTRHGLDGVEFGLVEDMVASCRRLHRAVAIEHKCSMRRSIATSFMLRGMHKRALNNLLVFYNIDTKNEKLRNEPSPISEHPAPAEKTSLPSRRRPAPGPLPNQPVETPSVDPIRNPFIPAVDKKQQSPRKKF